MAAWRDNVANELPIEIPGTLIEDIEEAWAALADDYGRLQSSAHKLEELNERFRRFDSFADSESIIFIDVWQVHGEGPPFELCLVVRPYTSPEGRAMTPMTRYECRMLGLLELASDAGRALIRPESIGDTLLELFRRREVDFPECPDFCGSYYVLASAESALREVLPQAALDLLGSRKDLFIEIVERDLLLLWPSVIRAQSVMEAADFLTDLALALAPASSGPYR
jgi:hypothetical protein